MRSKYKNKKQRGYDSKKESRRAFELEMLQKAGEISNLKEPCQKCLMNVTYQNYQRRKKI